MGLGTLAAASVLSGLISGPLSGSAATFLAFAFVEDFAGYLAVSIVAGLFLGANDRTSRVGALPIGTALFASSSATLLLRESFCSPSPASSRWRR